MIFKNIYDKGTQITIEIYSEYVIIIMNLSLMISFNFFLRKCLVETNLEGRTKISKSLYFNFTKSCIVITMNLNTFTIFRFIFRSQISEMKFTLKYLL